MLLPFQGECWGRYSRYPRRCHWAESDLGLLGRINETSSASRPEKKKSTGCEFALKGQQAFSPTASNATPWVHWKTSKHRPERAKAKMAQSLNKIFLHIIFHIKTTSPRILDADLERLHQYIGQLINATGCQTVRVGGVEEHIHAVCMLSREETVSHLVEEMKRNNGTQGAAIGLKATLAFQAALTNRRTTYERRMGI